MAQGYPVFMVAGKKFFKRGLSEVFYNLRTVLMFVFFFSVIPCFASAELVIDGVIFNNFRDTYLVGDNRYLYNDLTVMYFNDTRLNLTIEDKISVKLDMSDQRYNDSSQIISANSSMKDYVDAKVFGNTSAEIWNVVNNGTLALNASLANKDKWDEAYLWGNHAEAGYLTEETDPIYSATELPVWLDDVTLSDGGSVNLGTGDFTTTGTLGAGAITGFSITASNLTEPSIPYASTDGLLLDSPLIYNVLRGNIGLYTDNPYETFSMGAGRTFVIELSSPNTGRWIETIEEGSIPVGTWYAMANAYNAQGETKPTYTMYIDVSSGQGIRVSFDPVRGATNYKVWFSQTDSDWTKYIEWTGATENGKPYVELINTSQLEEGTPQAGSCAYAVKFDGTDRSWFYDDVAIGGDYASPLFLINVRNEILDFDTLTIASGSITDSTGSISFGNVNLSTTGTLGAGAITGTSFTIGANTISSFANLDSLADLSYASTSFVKMSAANTFSLDTNTYYKASDNISVGTLEAGVTTLTGNNGNNYFTELNLVNDAEPASGNMLQSVDIVSKLTQSIGGTPSEHVASRIRTYKAGDWVHATTEADTDSGMQFYYTKDGTETLGLSITPDAKLIVGGSTGTGDVWANNIYLAGTFSPTSISMTAENSIGFDGSSYINSYGEVTYFALVSGPLQIGDSGSNHVQFTGAGDISFAGTGGFYPRRISQTTPPETGTGATGIDTGEMVIWHDSDDGKIYFVYNDATSGIKKVEMT